MNTTEATNIKWIEPVNEIPNGLGWYGRSTVGENQNHASYGLAKGEVNQMTLIFLISLDSEGLALVSENAKVGFPYITEIASPAEININSFQNMQTVDLATDEFNSFRYKVKVRDTYSFTQDEKTPLAQSYVTKMKESNPQWKREITESITFDLAKFLGRFDRLNNLAVMEEQKFFLKITPMLMDNDHVNRYNEHLTKDEQATVKPEKYIGRITYAIEVIEGEDTEVVGSLYDYGKLCPPNCKPSQD